MGTKEKLIEKLKSLPKDMTFQEMQTLLKLLGYTKSNKGKTSGLRVIFIHEQTGTKTLLHKPHPGNELAFYQIKQIREELEQEGLI